MVSRGSVIAWSLGVVPVLVALPYAAVEPVTAGTLLNAAGRLTGIGGIALLLVAAMISCRAPGFDRHFGGLTKLWRTHHMIGAVAFLLVLAHPLMLAFAAADVSARAAAHALVPQPFDWSTAWGWCALLVMTVFLAPSFAFFGEPEYQRWRNVHRLAAAAVIAGVVHTWLAARTMPDTLNAVVWTSFTGAVVAAVACRFVLSRAGRRRYVITGVARPAANIVELSLTPQNGAIRYEPGQFVYLTPYDAKLTAGNREEHPYTLSSSPTEDGLRVAVKDLGDATEALQHIRVGSEVRIEGPYGCLFSGAGTQTPELWIAGGIGIAPFLSRARHLAATGSGRARPLDAHLVYCVQDESRAHFRDELTRLCSAVPGLSMTLHFFAVEGPLRQEFLARHCADYPSRTAYLCGPLPLIRLAKRELTTAGVPRRRIRSEELTLL